MATPNPFHELGLAPASLAEYPDAIIWKLIQARYRVLSELYHPDVEETGSIAQFRRIAAAYKDLNLEQNAESCRDYIERYVRKKYKPQAPIDALERQRSTLRRRVTSLSGRLTQCWATKLFGALKYAICSFEGSIINKLFELKPGTSVFEQAPNSPILLRDCIVPLIKHRAMDRRELSKYEARYLAAESSVLVECDKSDAFYHWSPPSIFNRFGSFYRLLVNEDGTFSRTAYKTNSIGKGQNIEVPKKFSETPDYFTTTSIDEGKMHSFVHTPDESAPSSLKEVRVIGSLSKRRFRGLDIRIPKDEYKLKQEIDRKYVSDGSQHEVQKSREFEYKQVLSSIEIDELQQSLLWVSDEEGVRTIATETGFTIKQFMPMFMLLIPEIKPGLPLVGMRIDEEGELRFYVLGLSVNHPELKNRSRLEKR